MKPSHRPLTVASLLLAMFMSAMEATVVGTAMPTVISDLGGVALYGWVGAAYLLASTVTMPLYGKLADLFGRKPVLMGGIVVFLMGSVGSGFASSITLLIVARAVQGLGAAAMQPVSMTIIGDLFTMEERGRVQGFFGAVWGIAGIAGPLLGGVIVQSWSWRWVFWINVPFGVAPLAVLTFAFRESPREARAPSIDWLGSGLLAMGATSLLLAAEGQATAVTAVLGLASLAVFFVVERTAKEPVVPLQLLARRAIAVSCMSGFLLGAAMMGVLMFVPLFAQGVLSETPANAGAAIAAMLVGWPIAAALTSRLLVRTGFRAPVWLGALLCATGLAITVWQLSLRSGLGGVRAGTFVFGLGMGLTNTAQIIAVQSTVEHAQRGISTAITMFARAMGSALGAGVLGAMLAAGLRGAASPEAVSALLDPSRRATAGLDAAVKGALSSALMPIFFAVAACGVANVILVAFYPRTQRVMT